jgi:sec-independent protein translocase protein TatB
VFNLQGSEIVFILLIALVVLGPEKLPDAVRRFTKTYAELKKMGSGFQSELKSALDEPMKQMQETASLMQNAADLGSLDASEAPGTETTEPETDSEAPGAETTEPETDSDAPDAETTEPETTEPETPQSETTEPETLQSETTEPETLQSDTTEPEPTQPGTPEHASSASPMNSIAAANSSASIASRSDRLRARAADDGAGAATSGEPQPDAGTTDVVDVVDVVDGQGVETPAEASSERLATQELSDGAART